MKTIVWFDAYGLLKVVFQSLKAVLAGAALAQDFLHLTLFLTQKRTGALGSLHPQHGW